MLDTGEFKICFSPVNHGDKMYKNGTKPEIYPQL